MIKLIIDTEDIKFLWKTSYIGELRDFFYADRHKVALAGIWLWISPCCLKIFPISAYMVCEDHLNVRESTHHHFNDKYGLDHHMSLV